MIAQLTGGMPAVTGVSYEYGGLAHGKQVSEPVQTTPIALTILHQLGLNPLALQAVRAQGTQVLSGG